MSGAIYRDSLAAVRDRVRDLEALVREREQRLTKNLMAHLPRALAARLKDSPNTGALAFGSFDELARCEVELTQYLASLEEALGLAPSVEADLRVLSDEPPPFPALGQRAQHDGPVGAELRVAASALGTIARELDQAAHVVSVAGGGVGVQFRFLQAPFTMVALPGRVDIWMAALTSVRRGTPPLEVRPRTTPAPDVGERFDATFTVSSTDATFAALSRPIRNALMELAHFDVPQLWVGAGVAQLAWRFDPVRKAVDAALHALARLRELELDLRVLPASYSAPPRPPDPGESSK